MLCRTVELPGPQGHIAPETCFYFLLENVKEEHGAENGRQHHSVPWGMAFEVLPKLV